MQQGIQLRELSDEVKNRFKVYPIPATDVVNIEYLLNENSNAQFVLYSSFGQQLLTKPLLENKTKATINTEQFQNGLYYYSIYVNNNELESGKIVIIH